MLHLIREESEQEDEDALESERSLEPESPSAAGAAASDHGVRFVAETPSASAGALLYPPSQMRQSFNVRCFTFV